MPPNRIRISRLADRLIEAIFGASSLYVDPKKKGEQVAAACWITPDGDIYAADSHYDAALVASDHEEPLATVALQNGQDIYELLRDNGWRDGFVTDADRFVTRQEALQLARAERQVKKTAYAGQDWLDSQDVIRAD